MRLPKAPQGQEGILGGNARRHPVFFEALGWGDPLPLDLPLGQNQPSIRRMKALNQLFHARHSDVQTAQYLGTLITTTY